MCDPAPWRLSNWLTKRAKAEPFEQARWEYEFGAGKMAGVSRQLGTHGRVEREALRSADSGVSKLGAGVFGKLGIDQAGMTRGMAILNERGRKNA